MSTYTKISRGDFVQGILSYLGLDVPKSLIYDLLVFLFQNIDADCLK